MVLTQEKAASLVTKYHDSIDYLSTFGNPLEKAAAQIMLEAAGVQHGSTTQAQ